MEANIAYYMAVINRIPLLYIFLFLGKAYGVLDHSICIETLRGVNHWSNIGGSV